MKADFIRIIFYTILVGTLFYSCSKDKEDEPTPNTPGGSSNPARDSALEDYNVNYLGSGASQTSFTYTSKIFKP